MPLNVPNMVTHSSDSKTWEAEVGEGDSGVKLILGYTSRLSLKTKEQHQQQRGGEHFKSSPKVHFMLPEVVWTSGRETIGRT